MNINEYACQRCGAIVFVGNGNGASGLCNDCLGISQDDRAKLIRGDMAPTLALFEARRGANVEIWPCQEPFDFRMYSDAGPMTTVIMLTPLTDAAKAWVEANVGRDNGFQPDWPTLFVEHGYVDVILEGIDSDGLTVDVIERALGRG